MKRANALAVLVALAVACGGPTSAENCTELQRYVTAEYGADAHRDDIGEEKAMEIAEHADELAGKALAAGADREWALCYDIAAQVLSNIIGQDLRLADEECDLTPADLLEGRSCP